ncbi:hypothetical protein DFR70_13026 [Nocardia tenerifensis]|uniref:Uncharacterized protein n=1 Tax=Nocardia tenerifensis TaxID=228006 RepID=A0A318JLH3_9NOCA|nr:hypothetical protein [Nocardia tenerifensis]PXX52778.1 hypothetical protein DFR70_13026 [Nocardia tenerifensis]
MVTEVADGGVGALVPKVSARRSQNIARARKRKRQQAIVGEKKRVEVTMALADYERVLAPAAAEAGMTVPKYLLQCSLNPVGVRSEEGGKAGAKPWLPWPKRQVLQGILLSATSAMDTIRLRYLAHIGAGLDGLIHSAHVTGVLDSAELDEGLAQLRGVMTELSERAQRIEALAEDVVRR